jgi:hypothetical protein
VSDLGSFRHSCNIENESFDLQTATSDSRRRFESRAYLGGSFLRGRVVGQSPDLESAYLFSGGKKYIRARVVDSGGKTAWTQPIFVEF